MVLFEQFALILIKILVKSNYSAKKTGVGIPAFIIKVTRELYRHSCMFLAGMTWVENLTYLADSVVFPQATRQSWYLEVSGGNYTLLQTVTVQQDRQYLD